MRSCAICNICQADLVGVLFGGFIRQAIIGVAFEFKKTYSKGILNVLMDINIRLV